MKQVTLTRGRVALVDDEDYEAVNRFKWHLRVESGIEYAEHTFLESYKPRKAKIIRMHRLIMGAPRGLHVDHRNGNGLDNQRKNLRLVGDSENQQNRHRLTKNTSGYRGVTFHKQTGKWQAGIKKGGISYHLGLHESPEIAARAYDAGALRLYGVGARLNFPKEAA